MLSFIRLGRVVGPFGSRRVEGNGLLFLLFGGGGGRGAVGLKETLSSWALVFYFQAAS